MKNINESIGLNEKIEMLQYRQAEELVMLKEQFYCVYESIKPINLIKNTLQEVTSSPDIKNNLVNSAIGLTTGFLSKKIWEGATSNPIKKLVGTFLEFAIANVVAKYFNKNKPKELTAEHYSTNI
jgi:hypothetical protein